jgi:hypothetical protein
MKGESVVLAKSKNSSAAFRSRPALLNGSIMMQPPLSRIEQQDATEKKGSPPAGALNAVCKSLFLMMCVPRDTTLVLRCGSHEPGRSRSPLRRRFFVPNVNEADQLPF